MSDPKLEVKTLFAEGKSVVQITTETKLTKQNIVKWLKDELKPRAIELRNNGKSYREIMEELGIGQKAIKLWVSDIELTQDQIYGIRNTYKYNLEVFKKEEETSYYLLGAFITDGNIRVSKDRPNRKAVSISSKDKDWLKLINDIVCSQTIIRPHGKNCFRLDYYSTELAEWFISKGCGPRKSLTVQFPDIPQQYLPDFIRGCWDGDGSLTFKKSYREDRDCWEQRRRANLASGSIEFCNEMHKALLQRGILSTVQTKISKPRSIEGRKILSERDNYAVCLSAGEDIYNLCKLIYYPNNPIAMPRKAAIAKAIIEDWERPFYCQMCSKELTPNKHSRHQKYCDGCWAAKEVLRGQQRSKAHKAARALRV